MVEYWECLKSAPHWQPVDSEADSGDGEVDATPDDVIVLEQTPGALHGVRATICAKYLSIQGYCKSIQYFDDG